MANPWASGAWDVSALASGSWSTTDSNAGLSWTTTSWAGNTWVAGSWVSAWAKEGTYTVNSQSATLLKNSILTSNYGSIALTGQDATLNKGRLLVADYGSIALTGQDATLTSSQYRITLVNTTNSIIDHSIGIQINGSSLTGTSVVKIQYVKGNSLKENSWVSGAWALGVWSDGTGSAVEQVLTNVSVVNPNLITADMFDVATSAVPYTDANHQNHRLYISNGTSNTYKYIQIQPEAFYIVGTVQPADVISTASQSIFNGITINDNTQVRLPVQISGINVTWETLHGNVTGRFTLASQLLAPVDLQIPIWDNNIGWDVINVTVKDASDVNTNLVASNGTFSLAGQVATSTRNYSIIANVGVTNLVGQDVVFTKSSIVYPSNIQLNSSVTQPFMTTEAMAINYVIGMGINRLQAGSEFSIYGAGFGNDTSLDIVLVDTLGAFVECNITQINNSYVKVYVPSNASALSSPITLYVGDYQRLGNGTLIISSNAPVAISGRNKSVSVTVTAFTCDNLTISQVWETSSFVQHHSLTVDSLRLSNSLSTTTNTVGVVTTTNGNLSNGLSLASPTLTQHNILSVDNISLSLSEAVPVNLYNPYLVVSNVSFGVGLQSPALSQLNVLNTNPLRTVALLESPTLTQHNILSVDSISISSNLESSSSNFIVGLNVNNLRCVLSENIVNNSPNYTVSPDPISFDTLISESNIVPLFGSSTSNLTVGSALESTTLIQNHKLLVANIKFKLKLSNPVNHQKYTLVVDNIALDSSLTNSRTKLSADSLKIEAIKAYPVVNGEILINQ